MNNLARFQRLTRHGGAFLALALFLALAQGLLLWSPSFAAQNTITVFTDDDVDNGNCTLREAIRTFSNNVAVDACLNDAEDDTITLLPGTYNLTLGALFIERAGNLTIQGAGANQTIINVATPSRAFEISTGANVTIRGVTIRNANAIVEVSEIDNGSGGAIYVNGSINELGATLTLENSVLENNTAVFGGGVLVFRGTLNIIGSTIANNTATTRGGGVFVNASTATIVNSTISGNSVLGTAEPADAPFDGGGIRSFDPGTLVIRNSTISGNTAPGNGGGIANGGMNVTLSNTILAGNTSTTAPDCAGAIGSAGYNLIGNNTGCTFTSATGDQVGTGAAPIDPQLGVLQNNGGTTPTRALAATSPALDLGNPAAPGAAPACAPTDQRGIARPQGTRCDIGAFELTAAETNPLPTLSSITPTSVLVGAGNTTLTVNGSNFVNGAIVRWDGANLATTFVNASQLTATIPAANLTTAGTRPITVFNPGPGGGVSAASLTFTINNPAPTITSITPTSATVGSGNTQLTVNGTGFVNNVSVVRWNGTALTTQFVSATQLTATIPAANLTATGTANITVFNPTPGGGESAPRTFAINNPVPTVTSVSPNNALAGADETTLTVNGTNFVDGAVVRWNGVGLATQFVSATQLTATIPATNLARGDTFNVTVVNPVPGGGPSLSSATFTVSNPAPTVTSISPPRVAQGGAEFPLTVNGTGFVNNVSVVRWNGANLATTFVSSTQLTAAIPASNLTSANTFDITVNNPGPGGGTSTAQTLTVFGPPLITVQPDDTTIDPGNQATLSVTASGEQPITYQWFVGASGNTNTPVANGDQATLSVSPTTTTSYWVRVTNAAGSVDSESALVTVTASPNPVPTLTAISPTTVQAGSNGFTLAVTGSNFVPGAVVRWNNQDRATTRVSSSRLEIAVSASDIANAGTASITVFNPGPGGGSSAPQTLTITAPANPVPTLTAISPATVQAGSNGFTLVVTGNNFVPGAVVRWNNQNRQTTRVSSSRLEIAVSASDIANAGTVSITVFNPGPGGGTSTPQTLTITAAPTEFRLFLPLLRR